MRLGYFADGPWAHQALKKIAKRPQLQVVYVVGRYTSTDSWLENFAKEAGIPFLQEKNVNDPSFIEKLGELKADLIVSMSFDQIFKKQLLALPPRGVVNCHAGALPFYRGRNVINWAIINDEEKMGVTVHYVDEGIDSGDIILQKYIDIDTTDNYGTVLKKAYELCASTLEESLVLISENKVERKDQKSIHPLGFYCGKRRPGDEYIDWSQTSEEVHNFIRALTLPGPGARTLSENQNEFIIWASELIPGAINYKGTVGEVVGRSSNGVIVKTGSSALLITSVSKVDQKELGDQSTIPAFPIGTRLAFNPYLKIFELEERLRNLEKKLL